MLRFASNRGVYGSNLGPVRVLLVTRLSKGWGYGMKRGLSFHGSFRRRQVSLAAAALLMAGLAAGPGMLAAHSAVPVGSIERVSLTSTGGERNAREEGGSSLGCSAL